MGIIASTLEDAAVSDADMNSTRPERRLAAISATDMVGYARMMEDDEIGTLRRRKDVERRVADNTVEEQSGRIVKRMGDGYIVRFHSVVSAIECAIAWQKAADSEITFRTGINVGDVIVEDDDLNGEGVNVAARLEAIADPGAVHLRGRAPTGQRKLHAGSEDLCHNKLKNTSLLVRV